MKKLNVYWAGIEYIYLKGSPGFGKLKGGFVYGFVNAVTNEDALEKIVNALNAISLKEKKIEFISLYQIETEWETVKQNRHYKKLYTNALKSNEVVFDDFYAYEK